MTRQFKRENKIQSMSDNNAALADLLLCDVGNTTIKTGFANARAGRVCAKAYSLPTRDDDTVDSLGLQMEALLRHAGFAQNHFLACAACSVRPGLNSILREAVARYMGCDTLFAADDMVIPLENRYERPTEVGADRLVGAYAARRAFPDALSLIVVDSGTALTFDCITGNAYLGGLIFPGPETAAEALAGRAARLPRVRLEVDSPAPCPCRDTATSIRHGLAFGYRAVVESLCQSLGENMQPPVTIIGTGGFAAAIGRISTIFKIVRPSLLLEGLAALYCEHENLSSDSL